jgi:predicted acetyltransferase
MRETRARDKAMRIHLDASITRAGREDDPILANLLQLYLHDMNEWFGFEVGSDGLYDYDRAVHWERGDSVYFARQAEDLAGFAIVGSARPWLEQSAGRDLNEFFVLRRHRHAGLAEHFAAAIFDAEPGEWLVRCYRGNRPALPFWRRSLAIYTGGRCIEQLRTIGAREWSYFTFASAPGSR